MATLRCSLSLSTRLWVLFLILVFFHPFIHHVNASDGQLLLIEPDTRKFGRCAEDETRATMCRACAGLPFDMPLPLEDCCTDSNARAVCEECLANPWECLKEIVKIEADNLNASDNDDYEEDDVDGDDGDDADDRDPDELFAAGADVADLYGGKEDGGKYGSVSKRFGTLFLGKRPLYLNPYRHVQADFIKRTGRDVDFEYDDVTDYGDVDKRWGTLGIGNFGRYTRRLWRTPKDDDIYNKRWGFLGISRGKRWGSLGIGKRWGSLGIGKRWGTVGIGKRWGTLGIGNWKRWGSLGLGRGTFRGSHRLSKRSAMQGMKPTDSNQWEALEADKKWGSLGIGNDRFGKRWGSLSLGNWRKRWGSLGIGKRWGALGIGNGFGRGKKWGSLGIGHGKRWGTLSLGKRPDSGEAVPERYHNEEDLSRLLGGFKKRWGTLHFGKRWGSLGGFGRIRSELGKKFRR